jgi:hypothetical protein
MAITKTIEIDVNSLQAVGGLKNLNDALLQVDKSAKGVDATFEEVYGDLKPLTARMGEAEDRLYELALAGQSASNEYKELLASVGNYRQVQMKTDLAVDAAATTFDAKLGGALQGVTSAFAGVQGAMALTGGQSEQLEQAILKVQGAMALAEGVRGIREGATSFKALGTSAKAALSGIKTGIAATGIGVLLIALGAVVAYWDDIKTAVNGVSSEQENLNKLAQTNLDAEQSKLDTIGSQDNVLKLQGKSEKDILKIKIAQTDQVIKASEIQIENTIATTKAQTEAAKKNKSILQDLMRFAIEMSILPIRAILAPLDLIILTANKVAETLGFEKITNLNIQNEISKLTKLGADKISSFVFDPKETQAEGDKVIAEQRKALEKLKNDRAGMQLSINAIDKQASNDAASKRKEANDKANDDAQKAKDEAIKLEQEKAAALERIRQGEIDTEKERRAEELRQVQEQYKQLIAEAEKYGNDTTALKEAQRTKEKELQDKFDAEDKEKQAAKTLKEQEEKIVALELTKEFDNLTFEAKREELKTKENLLLEDKTLTEEQRNNLEKSYAEARNRIAQAEADQKEAIQNAVLDNVAGGIGILKQLGEKNKGVQKAAIIAENAVGIARIILNTQAANAKSVAASPLTGGMPWVAVNTIGGALGIASSLLATKKALSELGGGSVSSPSVGGGSGGGGGMSAAAAAPQFNVVGNAGVNQLAETLGNQQPVQAFVVANQVTSQQSLDRNIVNNASLG